MNWFRLYNHKRYYFNITDFVLYFYTLNELKNLKMKYICKKELYRFQYIICYNEKKYDCYNYYSSNSSVIYINSEIGTVNISNEKFKEHFCTLDELRYIKIKKMLK